MFSDREQIALHRLIATFLAFLSVLTTADWLRAGEYTYAMGEYMGVLLADTATTPRGEALDLSGYETVFFDDFNSDTLNTEAWAYRADGARRAGFNSKNQVRVENDNLYIKAEYLNSDNPNARYGEGWYAGMIRTVNEYKYGYFEIRCICSKGGGFWSAFWLNSSGMASKELSQGGVGGAELDIFEAFNYDKKLKYNSVSLNIHVDGYQETRSQRLGSYKANNIYEEYNTYGLMWTPSEYVFYINGVECVRSTFADGVSQADEYAIISLELPSIFTKLPGFETEFIIDYVKIMQNPNYSTE
ncbi:MAG: Endo-1,3-1,4-beta-glycanase ExsH [Firmicutes bacterium ADurb.Bin300]|jgi:beta-glucanase (GH16 family)|nr:MAG: Endo-1,3-1,4-beta-glycanase ExsH [Firmicutes bacterium ADurb.Bin300]HOD02216.1 glycoside hydrolase family 16 protein [Clostridiales bacterium]